jgi:flagellar biosynthesis/type III secretory pathway M-ring protein FliF/YscJ
MKMFKKLNKKAIALLMSLMIVFSSFTVLLSVSAAETKYTLMYQNTFTAEGKLISASKRKSLLKAIIRFTAKHSYIIGAIFQDI